MWLVRGAADEATEISSLRKHVIGYRLDPYQVLRDMPATGVQVGYSDWATEHPG